MALAEAARDRGAADRSPSVSERFDVVVHVHANTGTPCGYVITLIHDHGYQIRWVDGNLEFRRPDGQPIPEAAAPTTGILEHLIETHAAQQLEITDDSLTPTWSGEALDPDPILLRLLTESTQATAA